MKTRDLWLAAVLVCCSVGASAAQPGTPTPNTPGAMSPAQFAAMKKNERLKSLHAHTKGCNGAAHAHKMAQRAGLI